ncbi:MAG: hypothetical protein HWN66_19955 [Candidatus Helarchaeota archaeon]|nr:hypothetical protein [Candidatus Helarchaeota archaeon]
MDDYEPQYVPFTGPVTPRDKKKKKEPEKEKMEKRPPEKKKGKPLKKVSLEEIKTYTWQMEKFQIMLAEGKNILVALMLDSAPSEPIREALLKFASQFENKFNTEIQDFRGNVSWFRPATQIADDSFNMFLMRPQCLPLTMEALKGISLTDIETKIVKIAQEVSQQTGYFFLATLLDEVLKRFRIPREKVLKSFFTLNRKKAFLPIQIADVAQEVEKRKVWEQVICVDGLLTEECDLLLEDLLVSNEESRISLLAKLTDFKKKKRGLLLREEVAKRRQIRKERDELYKRVDEFLKLNDYNEVVNVFNRIIQLSLEIGEDTVAQELTNRAEVFRTQLTQMAQRIPALRSQRNEALNQAELHELSGRYIEASKQFELAAAISTEIGEFDKTKEYASQSQRLISLAELASLRERLR